MSQQESQPKVQPAQETTTRPRRAWIDFGIGFVGWFVLNSLCGYWIFSTTPFQGFFASFYCSPPESLYYCPELNLIQQWQLFLPLPINVAVLWWLAFTRPRIALGALAAIAVLVWAWFGHNFFPLPLPSYIWIVTTAVVPFIGFRFSGMAPTWVGVVLLLLWPVGSIGGIIWHIWQHRKGHRNS